jgi:hypothetical protein
MVQHVCLDSAASTIDARSKPGVSSFPNAHSWGLFVERPMMPRDDDIIQ